MGIIEVLERQPLKRFHFILLTLSSLVYGLTAMNVMLIGLLLPAIRAEWGLSPTEAGYLLSFGYLGMFLGAISSGIVADRIGRKYTMVIMILVGSVFTGLCGLAWDFWSMSIFRVIAGVGLGGTLPLPGVYMSEYPPARYRGRFVGIVETAWVWGVLLGIVLARIIMPHIGWKSVFAISYLPLLLIPAIVYYAPESVRFLEKEGRIEKIRRILARYGLVEEAEKIVIEPKKEEKAPLRLLFSGVYLRRTVVLWVLWAVLVYTYHGIFLWLPDVYVRLFGYEVVKSLEWVLIVTFAQVPGYYSAAMIIDRLGRKFVLATYLAVAGLGCLLLASTIRLDLILLYSVVISFFNLGAWTGLYTYTPELYPTKLRGTGSGAAASVGRIAGILAPSVTGYLFEIGGGSITPAFLVFALAHFAAAAVTGILGEETKGRTLEEISR
ncbi:MAG: MFS transporter [Aigarchaeota archaeon]|nr:MFS transporter [Aigarchaeota archaeon]MDW8021839.1 MFS transporter [Nitrososphaerota archaeon]